MRSNFLSKLMQASLICCLALMFTGCEEFLNSLDNPISPDLKMNETPVTMKVNTTYSRVARAKSGAVIAYSSSNETVATVDQNGVVSALAEGTTTITASVTGGHAQYGDIPYLQESISYEVTVEPGPTGKTIDLATVTEDTTAEDGDVLTGVLDVANYPVKISIADNATVTLDGVTINGVNDENYKWAGINCEGNAIIILKDGTTNTVKGFYKDYPAIFVPGDRDTPSNNKTLTIKGETAGTGELIASGNGNSAGIGGGNVLNAGNIVIQGGIITATGKWGAGIGCGYSGSCGDITITGGTITASSGPQGQSAGIGCAPGYPTPSKCGNITITDGVTKVTATRDEVDEAVNNVGKGSPSSICGTVTIGGTEYWDGTAYKNGGNTYLTTATLTYPATINLSTLTSNYVARHGDILTGTLTGSTQPYKISIADGATVTLDGVDIKGVHSGTSNQWAGINCEGDATIILKDGTENKVKGFHYYYPGIFVPKDKTLTIKGGTVDPGKLIASGGFDGNECLAAGIGGGYSDGSYKSCGNIIIQGGDIKATGGNYSPGIGGGNGFGVTSGDITISGGTVEATGGESAPGIGIGAPEGWNLPVCGNITITSGITKVIATKGAVGYANTSIGGGSDNSNTSKCGTITFGTAQVYDGTDAPGTNTWTPSPMVAGTYGGLNLAISGNTWTLTPAP